MKNLLNFPKPLLHKLITTIIIGAGCFAVGAAYFLYARDKTTLALSAAVLVSCLLRAYSLYKAISKGDYETLEGVCLANTASPVRRQRTVTVLDNTGVSHKLRIPKTSHFKTGSYYRLYFSLGDEHLEGALQADRFLGYEELDTIKSDEN
jgi:hypothetical protein